MGFRARFGRSTIGFAGGLLLAAGVPATLTAQADKVTGIRFGVAGPDSPSPAQNILGAIGGVIEFASGRGRLDVDSVSGRAVSINGVEITRPLASRGEYYLFDSTGFVLVRPQRRTYSVFSIGRSWIHLGSARDSSEGFMEFVGIQADTLPTADSASRQHGPLTVRWHLDRRRTGNPPVDVLSRGWIEVADAPAGEGSAVRWFGAAAALAALSAGADSLRDANLQITATIVLNTQGQRGPLNLIVLHPIDAVSRREIDASRLALPTGFKETPWFGVRSGQMKITTSDDVVAHWREAPGVRQK